MLLRLTLVGTLVLQTFSFASSSFAADAPWPNKPVHIIVPFPAGAASDTVARLIGSKLSEKLGQPFIIYNREGASGEIGTTQLAQSEPDGYTIGIATTTTLVTAPVLSRRMRYDALMDFAPIAMIGYSPFVLVVYPKLPATNIKEYIALAKAKPGLISYSSEGEASLARLGAELFANMAGIKLSQIPYKSSTQGVIDLLAGRIDSQFGILTTTQRYIRGGELKALGVTTQTRIPELPDLPTIAESGLPGYEASLWVAFIAPAKTPPAIAERLSTEINEILAQPAVKEALFNQAVFADPHTPAELRSKIESDLKKWKDLATKAGLLQ
jgi:tripartite-type tricarboxylate transporter receptor subunit TctC